MEDNFYVYITAYLLNPAKESKLQPHLYKCYTAAHRQPGSTPTDNNFLQAMQVIAYISASSPGCSFRESLEIQEILIER